MADQNVEFDTQNEPLEIETQIPETPVLDVLDENPEPEVEVDVEQLQATNKKLYERAKNAEAALKASKANAAHAQVPAKQASPTNVEETVLLANGMSEDLLSELKAVATVRGLSLIKAQNDPIFIAVKAKLEQDKKREDASLPASRGAGARAPKKDFYTPGLTREEHMAMVKSGR